MMMRKYEKDENNRYRNKKSEAVKHARKPVQFIKLTVIYAACAFVIVFIICFLINNFIVMENNTPRTSSSNGDQFTLNGVNVDTQSPSDSGINVVKISGIPADASDIAFSFDGKYCTYIFDGKLSILDTGKNKTIQTISEASDITNAMLMCNRNILIYLTIGNLSSANDILSVYTYNIDTGITVKQKSFNVPKNTGISNLGYSTATSTVYFVARNLSDPNSGDTLYYLDIMKSLHSQPLGFCVNHIVMLNKSVKFYYEDPNNILFSRLKAVNGIDNKIKLLGCDKNDTVYMQSLDNQDNLLQMDSSGNIQTIKLQDKNFNSVFYDQNEVYLVYGNYLTDISSDPQKKMQFDPRLHFLGACGDKVYFRDPGGDIIQLIKRFQS